MKAMLALAALLGVYSPAATAQAGDKCVTNFRDLPSDGGWRRWRIVDGRRCWYVEGRGGTFHRLATAAPSDKTAQAFVPRAPLAPPAIADPPPAMPTQLADDEHQFMSFYDDRFVPPRHTVRTVPIRPAPPPLPAAEPPSEGHLIGAIAIGLAGLLAIVIGVLQSLRAPRPRRTPRLVLE